MSTIIFPSSPFNGQLYPEQPIPGITQYMYNAQADTWELAGEEPCICEPANNIILDNIAGLFDGVEATFPLTANGSPYSPPNAVQMIVTVGNIMQEALIDYTVAGATITFTTAPEAGLDCILLVNGGGQAAPASNLLLDDIQSEFDGVITTFGLTADGDPYIAANAEQLIVNLGGIQQKPGEHYTVVGSTITFTTAPAAGLNCFIIALYGGGFGGSGGGGSSVFSIDTDNNIWSCNTAPVFTSASDNFLVGFEAGSYLQGGSNNNFLGWGTGKYNTSGGGNNFIGFLAGYYTTTGGGNTFIGCCAGYSNTVGYDNIAIGRCAGSSCADGSLNVFMGVQAGSFAGGQLNVYIGSLAGNSNSSGESNVFIGGQSGDSSEGGFGNVGVGSNTARGLTNAANNVYVGAAAGIFSDGGDCNTAVGYCAGARNSTGSSYNSFFGVYTGLCNTTGKYNTFLGSNSGYYNTVGIENIFIGNRSGYNNTTGEFNTFVGSYAGNGNTTGNGNVGIGHSALYYGGNYNTAVGEIAMTGQSGSYNAALGYEALKFGSGNYNSAFGVGAMEGNGEACCNVSVGYHSLRSLACGIGNVAVGVNAGSCTFAGVGTSAAYYNVAIGQNALSCAGNLGFGYPYCNNIAIGYNAGTDAVATIVSPNDCNQIVIGNNNHTNAYIKVNWTVTSDERDKTCVAHLRHGIDFLGKISPVQYQWKDRETGEVTDQTPRYGFLAQDVLAAEGEPLVLVDDNDPENLKLRETMMIPILVNAFNELNAKYEALAEELAALKSQLN